MFPRNYRTSRQHGSELGQTSPSHCIPSLPTELMRPFELWWVADDAIDDRHHRGHRHALKACSCWWPLLPACPPPALNKREHQEPEDVWQEVDSTQRVPNQVHDRAIGRGERPVKLL
mmetsp:Transcript_4470/g.11783  ORF Transcript_4470/g.11783 Transcript_4470/m.11783 type:complete len:117 (-) Transcript_4470:772-1122(-)